jgi:hypothetical protein
MIIKEQLSLQEREECDRIKAGTDRRDIYSASLTSQSVQE